MPNTDLENEAAAALASAPAENQGEEIKITAENALVIMTQALVGIEKHLFALVYLEKTRDPAKTGVTFIPAVFDAIYDGSDPFKDVDEAVAKAAAMGSATNGA